MLDSLKVSTLHKAESYITLMLSGAYVWCALNLITCTEKQQKFLFDGCCSWSSNSGSKKRILEQGVVPPSATESQDNTSIYAVSQFILDNFS